MEPKIRHRLRPQTVADRSDEPIEETTEPTYTVGRNKPPVETRFGGLRGNKPGRKPKSHDFGEQLDRQLATKVPLVVDGKLTKVTKQELIAANMVNGAAGRDKGMIKQLTDRGKLKVKPEQQLPDNDDGDELVEDDPLEIILALAQLAVSGDATDRSDDQDTSEQAS